MKGFCFRAGLCVLVVGVLVLMNGIACATMPARPDDVLWSKTFGENGSYNCWSIVRTTDGGYVLGGLSASGTDMTAYAAKTDGNGSLLWANSSVPGSVTFDDVRDLPDGSIIFAGAFGGTETNAFQQGFLVKTGPDGRQLFARTYGLAGNCAFEKVLAEDDGSLVILGHINNYSTSGSELAGGSYLYVLKTDANGDQLWSKLYGGFDALEGRSMISAPGGGYALAGSIYMRDTRLWNAYLLLVDRDGNKVWDANYSGEGYTDIFALCNATDGGYVLAGQTSMPPSKSLYINRIALNGTSLWNRTMDTIGAAYDVIQASDGGFVMACGKNILKVNRYGDEEWERGFGTGNYSLNCVVEAADDSYVFGGYTETSGGNMSLWLLGIGMTRGPGFTPEGCCWPALVIPAVAISVVALRRRRPR